MAQPQHVQDLLTEAASAYPDSPAVRDWHGVWDYTTLDHAAHRAAAWLRDRGVRPGDRVAVRLGNVREFVALLFGAARAGAVFVPVSPAMKDFHLRTVLADSEPSLALTAAGDEDVLAPIAGCPVHAVTEVPLADGPCPKTEDTTPDPDDLALLIYTSGSTSSPKAVMSPHRTTVFAARAIAARLGYRSDDVVLTTIPLSFDYGLYQIFLAALAGAELVLTNADSHAGLMATIRRHGVTVLPLVPSLAEMLVRLASRDRHRNKGPATALRLVTNTGAALTPPLIAALRGVFPAVKVVPMFGITECKRVTILEPDGDLKRPFSVGRALPGTEVLVLDEQGRRQPPGVVGEIVVRGPHVMAGYWRAPELTAERFRRDPETGESALHTGDFGHLDEDGHLYFHGRRDDMFKRRGVRMSALEIEAAALDIPGVTAVAVLPPADGHELTLFAVGSLSPKEIVVRLGERLEAAKVPPHCFVLDSLPLTANGKTDKKQLYALADIPAERQQLAMTT